MMIYLDNSATTLQKPPGVARAAAWAIEHLGNAGRGAYPAAAEALRQVYAARCELAALCGVSDAARVAFTSGATESLNLLIGGLLGTGDHVITTVLEHNSVLRPLYQTGCALSFLGCDDSGALLLDELLGLLRANTRAVVCTQAGNVTGSVTDTAAVRAFCDNHGLLFILDAAQALGYLPAGEGDFICFTGHKALMGPQGVGGVLAGPNAPKRVFKTGGAGFDSFASTQPSEMPGMLEAGTQNLPGIHALGAAAAFINKVSPAAIRDHGEALCARFLDGIREIPGLRVYGAKTAVGRLPVVPLNLPGWGSEELALVLWERYGIATRPGSHCAPLAHRRFGTERTGMVRFSFGWYNTAAEVDAAVQALAALAM